MKVLVEQGREIASGAFVSCVPEIEPPKGWGAPIGAALVYDGEKTHIPTRMGTPRADQMQGTELERLAELAGRTCYDSLGSGRNSEDYHNHIREVGHLSTLEHANVTFSFLARSRTEVANFAIGVANRPGVHWSVGSEGRDDRVRVTLNARTLYEMSIAQVAAQMPEPSPWTAYSGEGPTWIARAIAQVIQRASLSLFARLTATEIPFDGTVDRFFCPFYGDKDARIVAPEAPDEKWVSLYIEGSRIMSHEIVRHGDWTAISQRSGRYCDESETDMVLHPAMEQFLRCGKPLDPEAGGIEAAGPEWVGDVLKESDYEDRGNYRFLVGVLERNLLASQAVQAMPEAFRKTSARKQARSAARGVLGHSLGTAMIFSASVRQWRHMLRMRAADAADAEIRALFAECILPILQASRYGADFADLSTQPASDGIGRCLAGGGAK